MCVEGKTAASLTQEGRGDAFCMPGSTLGKPWLHGKAYFSYLCRGYKRLLNLDMGLGNDYSVISKADLC